MHTTPKSQQNQGESRTSQELTDELAASFWLDNVTAQDGGAYTADCPRCRKASILIVPNPNDGRPPVVKCSGFCTSAQVREAIQHGGFDGLREHLIDEEVNRLAIREEARRRLTTDDELELTWLPVDLGPTLRGDLPDIVPSMLCRQDLRCLFYGGQVNGVHGDSGLGKSWVVLLAAAQELTAGRSVAWLNFEDPTPQVVVERLRLLGVGDDVIDERLRYFAPAEAFTDSAVARIRAQGVAEGWSLVAIDSLGEAFGLDGIDENADSEVGPWLRRVARSLADAGMAVVIIDHSTKAADNPLHPSGSKRKRAAITGASYLVTAPKPLTKDRGGDLMLTCAKDRHGHFRRGEHVARVTFTVYPDEGMTWHVWPATGDDSDDEQRRLVYVARKAVEAAKAQHRELTRNELEGLIDAKGGHNLKRGAIDFAVGKGALTVRPGPNRSMLYRYAMELEDGGADD